MSELAPYLPGMLAAYAILFVGALSPGPSVALLMGVATEQGRAPALVTTFGIAIGSCTINLLTYIGVGVLLSEMAWVMMLLKIAGALYLLYLAYGAFSKVINPPTINAAVGLTSQLSQHHFMTGYLLEVTNPKAISFWLAISAVGAADNAPAWVVTLFVLGSFCVSFACHGFWAIALSVQAIRRAYVRARRWVEAVLGSLFVFFAFKLGTSE